MGNFKSLISTRRKPRYVSIDQTTPRTCIHTCEIRVRVRVPARGPLRWNQEHIVEAPTSSASSICPLFTLVQVT
jgi:hypothetical protein